MLGPSRALTLNRLSAFTASLHVDPLEGSMRNPMQRSTFAPRLDVCSGSLADMCSATAHVCYGPEADTMRFERKDLPGNALWFWFFVLLGLNVIDKSDVITLC